MAGRRFRRSTPRRQSISCRRQCQAEVAEDSGVFPARHEPFCDAAGRESHHRVNAKEMCLGSVRRTIVLTTKEKSMENPSSLSQAVKWAAARCGGRRQLNVKHDSSQGSIDFWCSFLYSLRVQNRTVPITTSGCQRAEVVSDLCTEVFC